MSLEDYRRQIRKIIKANSWKKTPNVTLLESIKKIIEATDKWRRMYPNEVIVRNIVESIFYLIATTELLDGQDFNLDQIMSSIIGEKKYYDFTDKPDDIVWSFIAYESKPHIPYRRRPTASQ